MEKYLNYIVVLVRNKVGTIQVLGRHTIYGTVQYPLHERQSALFYCNFILSFFYSFPETEMNLMYYF